MVVAQADPRVEHAHREARAAAAPSQRDPGGEMSDQVVLRSVFEPRAYMRDVASGTVRIDNAAIEFVHVAPVSNAMQDVADRLAYDLGEITLTDYMLAKEAGRRLLALPIFPNRSFPHGRIMVRTDSKIEAPKDLEGKRVAIKSYPQTAAVWGRGVLHAQYGVDIDKVTWVAIQGAHVPSFVAPANVERAPDGATVADLLLSGAVHAADDPGRPWSDRGERWEYDPAQLRPLEPNGKAAARQWYAETGVYPILHALVLREEITCEHPKLARAVFDAFTAEKNAYLANLDDPVVLNARGRDIVGRDFLPYGVTPNRAALETLCEFAYLERITARRWQVDELFGPSVSFDE